MAITRTPSNPYTQPEWLAKPRAVTNGEGYAKYNYKDGESLLSIAGTVSTAERQITWQELTNFNWGTSTPSEINWYLEQHNGCRHETADGNNYYFTEKDAHPFVWVPQDKIAPPPGKYRSPGKKDVGHVALDDESNSHINTLVIRPTYTITLELGDVDALFESDTNGNPTVKGRQQRLQALGYLYRPLKHAFIDDAYQKVWKEYGKIHGLATDRELDAKLKEEVRNNLVVGSGGVPTKSGQIHKGGLPKPGSFGAIRVPGGYCYNFSSRKRADHDSNYAYGLFTPRHEVEEACYRDNDLLGKVPLVARVHKVRADGKKEPVEGVAVYFQLVKPEDPTGNLKAPELRNTEMDFSKDHVTDAAPFEVTPAGPKKFVDDAETANTAADPDDPQAKNTPAKFGGKRDIPVEGKAFPSAVEEWLGIDIPDSAPGGVGGTYLPGVFEVGEENSRVGLHKPRSKTHADYGNMTTAVAVTPDGEDHKHAVKARTNKEGNAGVIFLPSRCGGDKYKIRAYVGPELLEFNGEDPEGPVADTGTMVVWRNIRLHRYIRLGVPLKTSVSQAVKDIFPYGGTTLNAVWATGWFGFDKGVSNIDMSPGGTADAKVSANAKSDGLANYRPLDVQFIGPAEQYRRCYSEFIVDCKTPETGPTTTAEVMAAFTVGLKAAEDNCALLKPVEWNKLVFFDPTSPFLLNIRHHDHYNSLLSGWRSIFALDAGDMASIKSAISRYMLEAMMEHLSGGGALPGLTLVYTPAGSTWDAIYPTDNPPTTSGVGLAVRGCFLWYSAETYTAKYFPYSATANALHELGHVLVRPHQDDGHAGGPDTSGHEPITGEGMAPAGTCNCVMSYRGCYGQLCGRCSLALRGWKTKSKTYANGI